MSTNYTVGYYDPDLSGSLDNYRRENDAYQILRTNQKITFRTPVFKDTITAVRPGPTPIDFEENTDWVANSDDLDDTAMSQCVLNDAMFNRTLVKSITIISSVTASFPIVMSYQQLWPIVYVESTLNTNTPITVTPDTIRQMIQDISILKSSLLQSGTPWADTTASIVVLDIDLYATNDHNYIRGESYTINTFDVPGKKNVILPVQGPFYRKDLKITIPEYSTSQSEFVLEHGLHYQVINCDLGKTKISHHPDGVHSGILISFPFAGVVNLDYRAFGGEAAARDVERLYNEYKNIASFLSGRDFMTAGTLADAVPVRTLEQRLLAVEEELRILTPGAISYADTTHLQSFKYILQAPMGNTNLHWYNIASLYLVEGANTPVLADRFKFRMTTTSGTISDVTVAVDLTAPEPDRVKITADNTLIRTGYELFDSSSPVPVNVPRFRVIWNNVPGVISGAILQIGFHLPTSTETVGLEDLSGRASCWKPTPTDAAPRNPQSDAIALPDGASVWSSSSSSSLQEVKMLGSAKPYRLFEGSLQVHPILTNVAPIVPVTLVYKTFDLKSINKLSMIINDGDQNSVEYNSYPLYDETDNSLTAYFNVSIRDMAPSNPITYTPRLKMIIKTNPTNSNAIEINMSSEDTLTLTQDMVDNLSTAAVRYILASVL